MSIDTLVETPLQRALEEIHGSHRFGGDPLRPVLAASVVTRIDHFLGELEEVHLRGGIRVPDAVVARLSTFLSELPRHWPTAFPLRTRISYVMEDLFTLQDHALDLKVHGRNSMRVGDERAGQGGD